MEMRDEEWALLRARALARYRQQRPQELPATAAPLNTLMLCCDVIAERPEESVNTNLILSLGVHLPAACCGID